MNYINDLKKNKTVKFERYVAPPKKELGLKDLKDLTQYEPGFVTLAFKWTEDDRKHLKALQDYQLKLIQSMTYFGLNITETSTAIEVSQQQNAYLQQQLQRAFK